MSENINFTARLVELAKAQAEAEKRGGVAKQMRDAFYEMYVKPYDDELAALKQRAADLETALKTDTLAYVEATGDLDAHPSITYRRTTKLVYDKDEVLKAAKERGATEFIRVKEELDVRPFEKAVKDGQATWAQVEEVPAPTVAIGKLGDILIALEVEAQS